jgi:hypothetical protein
MDQALQAQWFQLATSIGQLGYDIIRGGPKVTVTPKGDLEPTVLATVLMSRALSNFRGVITLLTQGLIVEARILVRCCFEDAFWVLGLREQGEEFAKRMLAADVKSKKARGELIFSSPSLKLSEKAEKRLRAEMRTLNKRHPKPQPLDPNKVILALEGVYREGYLVYSQLSSDAAHPTLESLRRHIGGVAASSERTLDVVPPLKPTEIGQTRGWACNAMLAMCVAVDEIFGGTAAGLKLQGTVDQCQALTAHAAASNGEAQT